VFLELLFLVLSLRFGLAVNRTVPPEAKLPVIGQARMSSELVGRRALTPYAPDVGETTRQNKKKQRGNGPAAFALWYVKTDLAETPWVVRSLLPAPQIQPLALSHG
jgi:hypothetical protein